MKNSLQACSTRCWIRDHVVARHYRNIYEDTYLRDCVDTIAVVTTTKKVLSCKLVQYVVGFVATAAVFTFLRSYVNTAVAAMNAISVKQSCKLLFSM